MAQAQPTTPEHWTPDDFLDERGKFGCISCGNCCKNVYQIPALQYLNRGDGVCQHLQADGRCGIYATRPDICRLENYTARPDEQQAFECAVISNLMKGRA